jgi:hypothetical protein
MARTMIVVTRKLNSLNTSKSTDGHPVVELEISEEPPEGRAGQSNRYEVAVDAAAVAHKRAEQEELEKLYSKKSQE